MHQTRTKSLWRIALQPTNAPDSSKSDSMGKQIRANVSAEFDRVVKALGVRRKPKQTEQHQSETRALIAILEEKRAEVMAKDQAGYFIHDWQELRDQVRRMIIQDPRYLAIKAHGVPATDSIGEFR